MKDFGVFRVEGREGDLLHIIFPDQAPYRASNVEIFCFGRIAELEAAMAEAAHIAATLATAETGHMRNRIMSVSNRLNAALGRSQSSHGDQF